MNVENIPTYLKEHASWCNFRYEERKENMTKVPYNPATGYKAYVNKPETFTDFDTARFYINSDCELARKEANMDRSYRFDLSMFERFEHETRERRGFEPHMMLKNKNGTPFLVQVSNQANPARWMVVGNFFDAPFLSYKDLQDFIKTRELEVWTESDDISYGRNLSNICKCPFRVEL